MLPEGIVITRDGVSEGQYRMVIEDELNAIKEACEEYGNLHNQESWKPRFTLVISCILCFRLFQCHQLVNFFTLDANPLPGTVVDTDVVRNDLTEFYMLNHRPVQVREFWLFSNSIIDLLI
ncbi:unnamed protein product [Strongylus vulgaris]|uniref:Piwi domain-containing protein n=1 Tax=Strongylus vulgaris TaxID=40348 RepID=A0A3P7J2S4_STRVU|nr:unnamed protein product [Strongylus vulgaris]